jgi:hypothetical protein
MVKRVKNSLVHKPVEITPAEPQLSGHDSATMQLSTTNSIPKISQQQSERPFPTYNGPAIALLLHKFIDAFCDMPTLDYDPNANHCYYRTCRPKALRAFKILEEVLLPCAGDLEEVESHRYGDADVKTSQISDISPHKRGLVRKHTSVLVKDSSD